MTNYPHLLSPLRIGPVTVRNRSMQTAHVKLFAANAVDSQRNVDYQVARANGGAGLLITGNRVVHPTSTADERYIYEGELERWEEATLPVA